MHARLILATATALLLQACTQAPVPNPPLPPSAAEEKQELLLGIGVNIPLERAVQQIIPPGWTYRIDANVPRDARVTWNGGRPWPEVLSEALAPLYLTVKKSPNRLVTITDASTDAAATAPLPPVSPPTPLLTPEGGPAPWLTPPLMPSGTPVELWNVEAGTTLRTVLTDWATRAGWHVEWKSRRDFRIAIPASFEGDFTTATRQLIGAFADANPPISAVLYTGNKAVVVTINAEGDD